MPTPAKPVVVITDFPGVMFNVDPRDLPDGAADEQVNCCSIIMGELTVRHGIKPVRFEDPFPARVWP